MTSETGWTRRWPMLDAFLVLRASASTMVVNARRVVEQRTGEPQVIAKKPVLSFRSFVFFVAAVFSQVAVSQGYPVKPVKLIVPFAPGGAADNFARVVGQALSDRLGQPVVIDNKPGAGGTLAADLVAKSAPDGYTLLIGDIGANAIAQGLYPKLPYHALRDFAPITLGVTAPMVLVVNPGVTAGNLRELNAAIKSKPGTFNYASAGIGGISHLAAEMYKYQAGLDIVHVPYKGGGQVVSATVAGDTQLIFTTVSTANQFIRSGKVKAIAVASAKRATSLPDTPTMVESGMAGFVADSWSGVLAPAATPKAIVEQLGRELKAVLSVPATRDRLTQMGFEVVASSPAEFQRFIEDEVTKWASVVQAAKIRAE